MQKRSYVKLTSREGPDAARNDWHALGERACIPLPEAPTPGRRWALSVAHCRRILGPECQDSDEEILANRDRLIALAHALVELREDR